MKLGEPLLPWRPPGYIPATATGGPPANTFSRSVLRWSFTRPADALFTPSMHPDYWSAHLAWAADLVYLPEAAVRVRLEPHDCASVAWFDQGSTQAVGYLHQGHACLVFRGTQELVDWRVNACCVLYGSPGRHLGFHFAWKAVSQDVLRWLASLPAHAGICVAGHSLGGALALISALDLCERFSVVGVRTFGCPRVGSIEFSLVYGRCLSKVTQQFKYGTDAVTIIPPMPFFVPVSYARRITAVEQPYAGSLASLVIPQPEVPLHVYLARAVDMCVIYTAGIFGASDLGAARSSPASSRRTQEPLAILLGVLVLLIVWTHMPSYLLSHGRAWSHSVGHSRTSAFVLALIAVPLVQQLSYLVPLRIHSALRWVLAIAAIAVPASLHLHLLWLVPVFVVVATWIFLGGVFLLRLLEPSVADHTMSGYILRLPIEKSAYAKPRTATPVKRPGVADLGLPSSQ